MDKGTAKELQKMNDEDDFEKTVVACDVDLKKEWKKLTGGVSASGTMKKSGGTATKVLGAARAKRLVQSFITAAKAEGVQFNSSDDSENSSEDEYVR